MGANRKRSRKERRLGARRLRKISPYMAMTSFIMPTRNDALVNFADTIDISDTDRFIQEQRKKGMKGLGILHLFIASYIRAVSQCPQLNRFICGQRVFARDVIEVVMTIKKKLTTDSEESSIKILFTPDSTLQDVFVKLNEAVAGIKEGPANDTDKIAAFLMSLPRGILRFVMWILRIMDYHGWLPRALVNASPFHGSLILTDVGSLGIPPVFHHIYNFGNLPVFISFGNKYRKYEFDKDGQTERHTFIDYCVVIDERICDGSTYARGVNLIKQCFKKPEMLLVKPEEVKRDIE